MNGPLIEHLTFYLCINVAERYSTLVDLVNHCVFSLRPDRVYQLPVGNEPRHSGHDMIHRSMLIMNDQQSFKAMINVDHV